MTAFHSFSKPNYFCVSTHHLQSTLTIFPKIQIVFHLYIFMKSCYRTQFSDLNIYSVCSLWFHIFSSNFFFSVWKLLRRPELSVDVRTRKKCFVSLALLGFQALSNQVRFNQVSRISNFVQVFFYPLISCGNKNCSNSVMGLFI